MIFFNQVTTTSTTQVSGCQSYPCKNGGICNPLSNGGYMCGCPSCYAGTNCEYSKYNLKDNKST